MSEKKGAPDYLFEVSWEVCNKIGGIHTVIATKSVSLRDELGDKHIMIGPDLVLDDVQNPEFIPDEYLFGNWQKFASSEGLRIHVGRWNIASNPPAILVDFSGLIPRKDEIFKKLWEDYKLDSLSGQWDYIESTLFGYAVGEVIESFIRFNLSSSDKAVAQFHEWMTGAGILYLKNKLPQVATAFTTHATVVGRSLAGNYRPLYNQLNSYNAEEIAKEFNIISKQSIEKIAAQNSDVFTTVSEITAKECTQFLKRDVDQVTVNGFENAIIPTHEKYQQLRKTAREKLLSVASCLTGEKLPDDTYFIATSGRYEFKNKGIDLFIDSLAKLKNENKLSRPIIAYILTPANHYGPRKDLSSFLQMNQPCECSSNILTHNLHDAEWDPILQRLKNVQITNNQGEKVKVIFAPCYLNGKDGIFNISYYDLLVGFDQTIFASYYEPWGYTPLESLAFSVPSITTSLAGFGLWVRNKFQNQDRGIAVIDRDDTNDGEVVNNIAAEVLKNYKLSPQEALKIRDLAFETSQSALWESLVSNYKLAYAIAIEKATERSDFFVDIDTQQGEKYHEPLSTLSNDPKWKRVIVKSNLPNELKQLAEIFDNIWWTWDDEAQELFEQIDPDAWKESDFNPGIVFEQVPIHRLEELSKDKPYIDKLNSVYNRFKAYLAAKDHSGPEIAYFSMEFGFHDSIKLYSGGLGILAGDYLKEASDANVNIVAVSLLYRYGYFKQMITNHGEQQSIREYQHFSKMPLHPIRDENGDFKTIQIMLPGRALHVRIWLMKIGRIKMYLMDTDFDTNLPEDRGITHQLYGGDNENRLKQELVLGVGGIRVLQAMCISPQIYHSNEGHSAFINLERIRIFMKNEQLTFSEAKEIVRGSTLFTTHTPVPAGHDHFDEDMLRQYMGHYPSRLRISWEEFMALGRANPNDWSEKFNMSYLAAHLAQEVNGVSMLHGAVTRDMFAQLWPGYLAEELHVNFVTNGVHWSTWTAKEWKVLYNELFDNDFINQQHIKEKWHKIYDVDNKRIWDLKQNLRSKLIKTVKNRLKENWIKRHEDPKNIISINNTLSEQALTIVFARRFATYKRAHLLFRDLERLAKLLNNKERPVQFIFAGKAHPADKAGQDLIKMIVDISKRPEFLGKILFIQNYSIGLAKLLVSGADIWLNTPTRPLEASGTSGEKAVMNGTLHFSVLDGWWVEGYRPDAGWALTNVRTYTNQQFQDDLDAEVIYSTFEDEILPAFYNRDHNGIPHKWIEFIKNTIADISPKFTTRRMINDYHEKFYLKIAKRNQELVANDFALAQTISGWKKRIELSWDKIEVLGVKLFEKNTETIAAGKNYTGQVIMDLHEINPENVGVELIATEDFKDFIYREEFKIIRVNGTKVVYEIKANIDKSGTFQYGIRVFPKHELLPHRLDFALIKWI